MDSASLTMLKKGMKSVAEELEKPAAETETAAEEALPPADATQTEYDIDSMSSAELDAMVEKEGIETPEGWEYSDAVAKIKWLKETFPSTEPEATTEQSAAPEDGAVPEKQLSEALVPANVGVKTDEPKKGKKDKAKKADKAKSTAVSTDVGKDGEILGPDLIQDTAHEIENIDEVSARTTLFSLLEEGDFPDFKIGGLLSVIQSNGWFEGYPKFQDYVVNKIEPKYGIGYRKALYLIQIYDALVESGVSWDQVKHLGWTKLQVIARVLTKDNVDQWVAIAAEQNVLTLVGTVKDTIKGDDQPKLEDKTVKTVTQMTFKVHEDQKATIEAAIEKAKEASNTDVATVALEYVCLDYMGGQSLATRMQAVGVAQAVKSLLKAFEGKLADVIKEIGVEETLQAIGEAAPELNIEVSAADET